MSLRWTLAVVVLDLVIATTAWAQVVALPAVEPPTMLCPGEQFGPYDWGDELAAVPEVVVLPDAEEPVDLDRPKDARDGVFQKLIGTYTWLAPTGAEGMGMSSVDLKTVLAFPIPSRDWPLIITPSFAAHFLDGPQVTDLPARLYDASLQFRSMRRLTPQWAMDLGVSPGVHSDFQQQTDEAFRITGYGAAMYTWSPELKFLLGVAYLDRQRLRVLPIGGLVWTPTPDLSIEIAAPRPCIAHRVYWSGVVDDDVQDWVYIAGELGGGVWAIRRADDTHDVATYTDYRVVLGAERRDLGGIDGQLEVGYVFGHSVDYRSRDADFDLTDTVMVRAGLTY